MIKDLLSVINSMKASKEQSDKLTLHLLYLCIGIITLVFVVIALSTPVVLARAALVGAAAYLAGRIICFLLERFSNGNK